MGTVIYFCPACVLIAQEHGADFTLDLAADRVAPNVCPGHKRAITWIARTDLEDVTMEWRWLDVGDRMLENARRRVTRGRND